MAINSSDCIIDAEELIQKAITQYDQYVNTGFGRLLRLLGSTVELRTEGCYMYDVRGRKYLDFFAGHGVYNLGFRHPKVVAAVKKQLDISPMASSRLILNKPLADLCERIAEITPGDLKYSFLCNSGAEANECAFKLARAATGKTKIIAAEKAFHGKTMGALSATAKDDYRNPFKPLVPGFDFVPYGDIEALEKAVCDDTAAIILEPIQGEGGVNCPPEGYLRDVRRLCDKTGTLFILDEVQTGMGRTGKMFACEHEEVAPDIMTLAKALGGGVMPIGACVGIPRVFEIFDQNPIIHTSTNGGNPLACVAAMATIDVLLEENLPQVAREKGDYLISRVSALKDEYPGIIAEVRGKGLLIGVEFVDEGYVGDFILEMESAGILTLIMISNQKVVRLEPPLVITYEQIDYFLNAFSNVLVRISTY